jgi:serine/threonine protein kinase
MGEVYEATAPDLGRRLAVKRVLDAGESDEELKLLFLRELAVTASLEHQNVVEVLDAGQAGADLYLVMEFVEGPSLAEMLEVLRQNGRVLPVELAVGIATHVAHGLAHAHERAMPDGTPLGIVHRDVAPENVLLGLDGVPKLVDFGLAKLSGHSLTQPGVVRGRPRCLSPEQARGDKVDARSDVFSLGAMLFEMVSGYSLYPNEQMATLLWKVAAGEYEPIARRMPGADPDLVDVISQCIAIDPERRFPSMRQLIRKLDNFRAARGLPLSSRAIAQVVAAVWPSVQAMRSRALDGSKGELEGRRLALPPDRGDGYQTPAIPTRVPQFDTARPVPAPDLNPLLSTVRTSNAASDPLPVPAAPAKDLELGPSEAGWVLYTAAILVLAALTFFGIWTSGEAPAPVRAVEEARTSAP